MSNLHTSTLAAITSLGLPAVAMAHPGHGHHDGDFSLQHYLTEPQHLLLIAGILAGGLLLVHLAGKAYRYLRTPKVDTSKPAEAKVRR